MAEEVIGGYRLQSLLMTGQNSQVWEVVEVSSHRHFAMKLLLPEKTGGEVRHLLLHEAEVGLKMVHPNVIKIVQVNKDPKQPFIVMEFFPSGSLKLRIVRKEFDWIKERATGIFKQAATGLAYMNASGWVHRDIKPDNILVNSAGEVRLIDFALARIAETQLFFPVVSPQRQVAGNADVYVAGADPRGNAGRPRRHIQLRCHQL